jgi:hypothetical protein
MSAARRGAASGNEVSWQICGMSVTVPVLWRWLEAEEDSDRLTLVLEAPEPLRVGKDSTSGSRWVFE